MLSGREKILLLGLVVVLGVYMNTKLPRGIRNNNPGNIRHSSAKWQGMSAVQTDPDFVQFTDPWWGIRAMVIVLRNYQRKHGLFTLRGILSRYAPKSENDTDAYVKAVAQKVGIGPDQHFNVDDVMPQLVRAMSAQENGNKYLTYYPDDLIQKGIMLA